MNVNSNKVLEKFVNIRLDYNILVTTPLQHHGRPAQPGPSLLYAENGTSVGPAEVNSVEYVWGYDPVVLLAVYGLAALGDLLVIVVGVVTMARQNRGVLGFEFARVLTATKASPELVDSVAGEWKDLLDRMPRETGKKTIRWQDGLATGEDAVADS
ncbi:hypothetical protein V8F33_014139 [Rhypophila sp. PSN 637]